MDHSSTNDVKICADHPLNPIDRFCFGCETPVCEKCLELDHANDSNCKITTLTDAANEFRNQIAAESQGVSACARVMKGNVEKIKEDEEVFKQKVSSIESAISVKFDELLTEITVQKDQLIQRLSSFDVSTLSCMHRNIAEIEKKVAEISAFQKNCNEILENGTDYEISRSVKTLLAQGEKLSDAPDVRNDFSGVTVTFNPTALTTRPSTNRIGQVHFSGGAPEFNDVNYDFNLTMFLASPIQTSEVLLTSTDTEPIVVFAVLNDELFVLRQSRNIDVYNIVTFAHCRQLELYLLYLNKLTNMYGVENFEKMVACPSNNSLYFCENSVRDLYFGENTTATIFQIDASSGCVTNFWHFRGVCHGLSLTQRNTLLAILYEKNKVLEYVCEGRNELLIREFDVDKTIAHPLSCFALAHDSRFVVSQQSITTLGTTNIAHDEIFVIDQYGRVVRSQLILRGEMLGSRSLAVDHHGFIIVAHLRHDFVEVPYPGLVSGAHPPHSSIEVLSPELVRVGYIKMQEVELSGSVSLKVDVVNRRIYILECGESRPGRLFKIEARVNEENTISPELTPKKIT